MALSSIEWCLDAANAEIRRYENTPTTFAELSNLQEDNERLEEEIRALERFRDLRHRHNDEMEARTKQLHNAEGERDRARFWAQRWKAVASEHVRESRFRRKVAAALERAQREREGKQ